MTELNGEIGSGFSVDVAKAWEQSFFGFKLPDTRMVALRIAIVLGKTGGVMKPFLNLARFGLGGRQGNGKQMFSWIHIEDVYGIIRFIEAHDQLSGIYNCSAPNPVTNTDFMSTLLKVKSIPFGLPSPAWLLTIGAVIIKTETELILKSRWVLPTLLQEAGYKFQFDNIEPALKEITL